jgi:hypothetical protein
MNHKSYFCDHHPINTKSLLEVGQNNTTPNISSLNLLNSIPAAFVGDCDRLDQGMDILLSSKLQHCQGLGFASDVTTGDSAAVESEVMRHKVGQWLICQTNSVECTTDSKDT